MMKRLIVFLFALVMCGSMWAQEVFTVVYATSDDNFVNVREKPSSKARVLDQLWMLFHGLGGGVLLEQQGKWTKVRLRNGVTGWCYSKYVGTQDWYTGEGDSILVAAKPVTELFTDNYADDGPMPLFGTVKKGTILGDEFYEHEGYYELRTGHDYVFIRKEDAEIRVRR
ncbi:MAG: SH3 domain-containing protein [Prevotella sp.]|jgi:hypothetical protein|nr:SH3 domain-containing protein [Prevotella sp.]